MSEAERYYGKYRGTVLQNVDPMGEGRVMVQVAAVSVMPSTWAMPCVPVSGIQSGLYAVPAIGASVWVEFEGGDPNHPIWVGGFWGSRADVPALAQATPPGLQSFVLQTQAQSTFMLSDAPGPTGGILLKTSTGALISVNDLGITISNGKGATIVMTAKQVIINEGALLVQ